MKNIFSKLAICLAFGASLAGFTACSDLSDEITEITYDRLFRPTEFKASGATSSTVNFEWECISDADHYQIEVFANDSDMIVVQDDAATPSAVYSADESPVTVENLEEQTVYSARIKAVSRDGSVESKYAIVEKTFKTKKAASAEPEPGPDEPGEVTLVTHEVRFQEGALTETFGDGKFIITRNDPSGKNAIDASTCYFYEQNTDKVVKFDARLKTGGKNGDLTLTIPGDGKLYIYVRTGSNSDATRTVVVTQNDAEILNQVLVEDDMKTAGVSVEGAADPVTVYKCFVAEVKRGTAVVTYPVNGVNFYGFTLVSADSDAPAVDPEQPSEPDQPATGNDLISYNKDAAPTAGITLGGTTKMVNLKIHENKDAIDCIQLANSYAADNVLNDNYIELKVEGGFKAGDVISIAGFFNNSDDSKNSAADIFVKDGSEKGYTVLFTTAKFINGRTSPDDPKVETFILTADAPALYIGRNGNTGTNICYISVKR